MHSEADALADSDLSKTRDADALADLLALAGRPVMQTYWLDLIDDTLNADALADLMHSLMTL